MAYLYISRMAEDNNFSKVLIDHDKRRAAEEAARKTRDDRNKVIAGLVAVALFIGGVVWWVNRDGDSGPQAGGGATRSTPTTTGSLVNPTRLCAVGIGGLALIAEGFRSGSSPAAIVAKMALPIIGIPACTAALESMDDSPSTPVPIQVTDPDTRLTITTSVTKGEIIAPATAPPPTTAPRTTFPPGYIERVIYCVQQFDTQLGVDLCIELWRPA